MRLRIMWTVMAYLIGNTILFSEEKPSKLVSYYLKKIRALKLDKKTTMTLEKLIQQSVPQIEEWNRKSQLTSKQRKAIKLAIQKALKLGKKGREFNAIVHQASQRTPEQNKAREKYFQLLHEFEQKVLKALPNKGKQQEFLDDDQSEKKKKPTVLVIRLDEKIQIPDEAQSLKDIATKDDKLATLTRTLDKLGLKSSSPLITGISPVLLKRLEGRANKTKFKPLHSLRRYWRVPLGKQKRNGPQLVNQLKKVQGVAHVYLESRVSEPTVMPCNDTHNHRQEYQDAADSGIDARHIWTQTNGAGAGIGLVDLESGWLTDHEDFLNKTPTVIHGDNKGDQQLKWTRHGSAVLGVTIADDNNKGMVGIAPSVDYVSLSSYYEKCTCSENVANAITSALPLMYAGDVLLLEVETDDNEPIEIDEGVFNAIRVAVGNDVVIIEAAGNGNLDLDAYKNDACKYILRRGHPDFLDSGAIMVGGSTKSVPHDRWSDSNYGKRLDCYSWATRTVATCGYGTITTPRPPDPRMRYRHNFNGTSSASAIIAGAAILCQGMYKAKYSKVRNSEQMRALLSNPLTGTAQGTGRAGHIGIMPDLKEILNNTLLKP